MGYSLIAFGLVWQSGPNLLLRVGLEKDGEELETICQAELHVTCGVLDDNQGNGEPQLSGPQVIQKHTI